MWTNGKDRKVPHVQVFEKDGDKYKLRARARRKLDFDDLDLIFKDTEI